MTLFHITVTLGRSTVKYDTLRATSVDAATDAITHFPDALQIKVMADRQNSEVAA